jgi:hypothetical protein
MHNVLPPDTHQQHGDTIQVNARARQNQGNSLVPRYHIHARIIRFHRFV